MAYPVPIVRCEDCETRFVLDPDALVEDAWVKVVRLLCRICRDDEGADDDPGGS